MKIDNSTFEMMKSIITGLVENNGGWAHFVDLYETGSFPRSDRVKDLQTRFCWDIYHACPGLNARICTLPDITDAHIFTALKAICPKVERKY